MSRVLKQWHAVDTATSLQKVYSDLSKQVSTAQDNGLFGQVRKVTINNSLILSSQSGYDIDFDIPFDDDIEVNTGTVTFYNLADNTLGKITKDVPVTIDAGYEHDSISQIFNGKVTKIHSYWDDVDYITEVTVKDYNGAEDTKLNDISYPANTAASVILQDLIKRLQIPVTVFKTARDYTFPSAVKITGSLIDAIKNYAEVCGSLAWICKSSVYVCPLMQETAENYFSLSAETGLLSVEEWTEKKNVTASGGSLSITSGTAESNSTNQNTPIYEDDISGVTAKMLFQNRIYTGCKVVISSRNLSGVFKVREGEFTADGNEMLTTIKAVRIN